MSQSFARIEKQTDTEEQLRAEQLRAQQRIQAQFMAEQQANQANQARLAELQQTLQKQNNQLSSAHKKHKELASQKVAFQVGCAVAVVVLIVVIIVVIYLRSKNASVPKSKSGQYGQHGHRGQPVSSLMTTSFDS
jgi:hypothetical protein